MSTKGPTFQDAVAHLQHYWSALGCVIWQPSNVEVGAGTMNPATFLHVLGPEPWNVAYVEPSIRPDDARYGENPNRMGRHHQFQVILKPDPGDPQQLFLDSLGTLGIDLARHDIRFVEDNWESPALGAWGLGWEVWLDGLEITQFTYFQQAGGLDLDPVSVEITYGLDRILMALQDVQHFKDLAWNERVRFGDVLLTNEVQTSRYYFEVADVDRLNRLYDLYEAEAGHALAAGLVRPGHDYLLKCSHVFNILDARGVVGVTERARYFGRMRRLARQVAEGYLAERQAAGHPLLAAPGVSTWRAGVTAEPRDLPAAVVPEPAAMPSETAEDTPIGGAVAGGPGMDPTAVLAAGELPTTVAPFLLELGVEELPVADQAAALAALRARLPELLSELRLDHGAVTVLGTPRRLAVLVEALAPRQRDLEQHVVGPPAAVAFDAQGRPTRAAEGFARSAGVTLAELTTVTQKGEARVAALRREPGRPAAEVLAEHLPALLGALPHTRGMRWNASGQAFSRPLRWLLALHGSTVIGLTFAGLVAGRLTRSARPQGSRPLALAAAGDYPKLMRSLGLELEPEARRAEVWRQVQALARQVGGQVAEDQDLISEIGALVEQPNAILGAFDARYLALPAAVLATVMKKHQRYFPVQAEDGALQPHFVAVANGAALDVSAVRHGNESVLAARFADAEYFWRQDKTRPLEAFTPALAGLTFQADLGSVLDKVRRLVPLVGRLAERLGLAPEEVAVASRAAALCKSDLATSMVVDFTALQGVMGREYARGSGEPPAVAEAIFEHYLPRGAGDNLPLSPAGTVLALADRLDSLVGLFAAGLRPTGAHDPFGLRRTGLALASLLVERELDLDLGEAVEDAAAELPLPVDAELRAEILDFLTRRLEGQLRDTGLAADAVAAALAVLGRNPHRARRAAKALEAHMARADWSATLTAYARSARIVRGQAAAEARGATVDPARFEAPAEATLWAALQAATELDRRDADAVLHALADLAPAINVFFDQVLVMAELPALRANRLALVAEVAALPAQVLDLSQVAGF